MAFRLEIRKFEHNKCDICLGEDELVAMEITSRDYLERQFINTHKDCLLKKIASAEKRYQAEVAKESVLAQGGQ